jgi:arylsulfatase A-like enzyme
VLLIIVDDLNTDISGYGHSTVRTPNIDRLAGRGVLFRRAYVQYPQCNQSRASMLTGQYPDVTGVLDLDTHFREHLTDVVTLPQHFRNQGYFTARIGKVFHQGVPNDIGTDGLDDAGSWEVALNPAGIDREVEADIISINPREQDNRRFGGTLSWLSLDSEDGQHTDGKVTLEGIRLLEENHPGNTGRPFFIALGYYRPHTPFVAPATYFDQYPLDRVEPVQLPAGYRDDKPVAAFPDRPHQESMSDAQKREVIQAYFASISFVDAQVGHVLDTLDRLDLAGKTLVVFVSDNGYHLGQHGLWQKSDLFEGSTRVPLIIAAPGMLQAGLETDALAGLIDIYPTLVSLSGLPNPAQEMPGHDLASVLNGNSPPTRAVLTQAISGAHRTRPERRGMQIMGYTIRTDRYRYTEWADGAEGIELYDYQDDPGELLNLAGLEEYGEKVEEMKALLENMQRSAR